ncbi:hypothetical protein [Hyphomonas sp.]|uniref:hypothetical protein n=1 Tax=Hyphomonas sp. TaxID=87 RepID=UPI00391D3379
MTRTKTQAEAAKAPETLFSAAPSLPEYWQTAQSALNPATAIENIRHLSEAQMAMAQFAAERARKNMGTLAAFATCRTPADFITIWRMAAMEAVSDYAEETARLLDRTKA